MLCAFRVSWHERQLDRLQQYCEQDVTSLLELVLLENLRLPCSTCEFTLRACFPCCDFELPLFPILGIDAPQHMRQGTNCSLIPCILIHMSTYHLNTPGTHSVPYVPNQGPPNGMHFGAAKLELASRQRYSICAHMERRGKQQLHSCLQARPIHKRTRWRWGIKRRTISQYYIKKDTALRLLRPDAGSIQTKTGYFALPTDLFITVCMHLDYSSANGLLGPLCSPKCHLIS